MVLKPPQADWVCDKLSDGRFQCISKDNDAYIYLGCMGLVAIESPKEEVRVEQNFTGMKSEVFVHL